MFFLYGSFYNSTKYLKTAKRLVSLVDIFALYFFLFSWPIKVWYIDKEE